MNTIPLKVVNSDPAFDTGLIGYSLLYSDNIRRGYWKNYDDAKRCLNNHKTEVNMDS